MSANNYTTIGRTKILEYLKQNENRTVKAQDILLYLHENGLIVNSSTVYRFLDKLCGDGRVMKYVTEDGSQAVFQYVETDHHCEEHLHLQCVRCGAIVHLECEFMEELRSHVRNDHGFEIQCKNSIIYGLCEKCRKS